MEKRNSSTPSYGRAYTIDMKILSDFRETKCNIGVRTSRDDLNDVNKTNVLT